MNCELISIEIERKISDLSNQGIGYKFILSCSAVSKIVGGFQRKVESNKELQERISRLDSQFKI